MALESKTSLVIFVYHFECLKHVGRNRANIAYLWRSKTKFGVPLCPKGILCIASALTWRLFSFHIREAGLGLAQDDITPSVEEPQQEQRDLAIGHTELRDGNIAKDISLVLTLLIASSQNYRAVDWIALELCVHTTY